MDLLTRLFADDRLSEAELEARLDRIYRATGLAEVHAAIADLQSAPAPASPIAPGVPAPVSREGVAPLVKPPLRIRALLSGREQSLTGVVPARIRIRARLAHIELDLSSATFEPGVTEIDVRAVMGNVVVRLPGNVRVESDGHGILGMFSLTGTGAADPDAPCVVHITGRALLGNAECHVAGGGSGSPRIGSGTTD